MSEPLVAGSVEPVPVAPELRGLVDEPPDEVLPAGGVAAAPLALGIRRLEVIGPIESRVARVVGLLVAIGVAVGFFWLLHLYWAPARPGVDQNAYLVGARMLIDHWTTRYTPPDPFTYVSLMWVRTPAGNYYPKYPIGLPLLYAIGLKLGGAFGGPGGAEKWAYLVSPVAMSLGLLATFLLTRLVAGSLAGLVAMLLLAASPLTIAATNSTMSHAADLCFAAWGVYLLARWWQTDTAWRGLLAGILLGFAVTIRYSEGLMVIPAAVAMLCAVRWRHPSTIRRTLVVPIGWLIPVAVLLLHNFCTMHGLTGYDSTHESTAFTWPEFHKKWEFTIQQFYDFGMLFSLPLGMLGLAMLYRVSWRFALLMTSWLLPGALLYSAYYWGDGLAGTWYLRFFLSLFPPLALGAAWLVRAAARGGNEAGVTMRGAMGWQVGLSVFLVGAAAAIGWRVALPSLELDHDNDSNLAMTVGHVLDYVPAHGAATGKRAVLFVDGPLSRFQILDPLQFFTDADLYTMDTFSSMMIMKWRRMGVPPPDASTGPDPIQPARREYFQKVTGSMTGADFLREQRRITTDALDAGRPVFLLVHAESVAAFRREYLAGTNLQARCVSVWKEKEVTAPDWSSRFGSRAINFLYGMPGAQAYELYQIERGPTTAPGVGRMSGPATRP